MMAPSSWRARGGGRGAGGPRCRLRARDRSISLRGFFADRDAAREVGRSARARSRAERPPVDGSRAARGELRQLAGSDPEGLTELLRQQHRADFSEDRVVVVRGWMISQTEAWLLALAASSAR
jgi:hypothetical protein